MVDVKGLRIYSLTSLCVKEYPSTL